MICPQCHHNHTLVTDTRGRNNGATIRRIRRCQQCGARFATVETPAGADDRIALANAAMTVRGEIAHLTTLFRQLEPLLKRLEG